MDHTNCGFICTKLHATNEFRTTRKFPAHDDLMIAPSLSRHDIPPPSPHQPYCSMSYGPFKVRSVL